MDPIFTTMTDVFKPQKRSEIMSHIRSKRTSPEIAVGKILIKLNFRYRLHVTNLPGNPDFANKSKKIAIFVNGCFWHQHKNCKRSSIPKSNKEYWLPKLSKNIIRQEIDFKILRKAGWKIVLVWECQTKDTELLEKLINKEICLN